jgi:hypothetical protein
MWMCLYMCMCMCMWMGMCVCMRDILSDRVVATGVDTYPLTSALVFCANHPQVNHEALRIYGQLSAQFPSSPYIVAQLARTQYSMLGRGERALHYH